MSKAVIARLTVDRPSRGLLGLRVWLTCHANQLERYGHWYTDGTFRGRFVQLNNTTGAKLVLRAPGALSDATRRRVAQWLRSRAAYLRKHSAVSMTSRRGWFKQEFSL